MSFDISKYLLAPRLLIPGKKPPNLSGLIVNRHTFNSSQSHCWPLYNKSELLNNNELTKLGTGSANFDHDADGAHVEFEGTGGARFAAASNVYGDSGFTFFCVLKCIEDSGTGNVTQPFANSNGSTDAWGFSWNHTIGAFQQAMFLYTGSYYEAKLTTPLLADTLYVIAGQYDGGSNLKCFLNGELEATNSSVSGSPSTSDLTLGTGVDGASEWPGKMYFFATTDLVLDDQSIKLISNDIYNYFLKPSVDLGGYVYSSGGGTTVVRLAGDGGLAGPGGLAGRSGGLAG